MRIAVLIPTIYRPAGLKRTLVTLQATAPECIAVVAAEKDDVEGQKMAERYGAIFTTCPEPLRGGAYAWNQALKAAPDFDAYFLGSDDIEFTPGWLEEVLRVLNDELCGSGFVGINDNRKNAKSFCATHYLMTRDFIIQYNGGVAAAPFYFCDWTDMEADRRARRANKWAWADKAIVRHIWMGPAGDAAYQRAAARRKDVRPIYEDRERRGYPDDFEPIITV
jgi:hypothetical protein